MYAMITFSRSGDSSILQALQYGEHKLR